MKRSVWLLILAILGASYIGCGVDLEPIVVVRIPQVPDGVASIAVDNQLGNRSGTRLLLTPSTPGELRFGISVAPAATETLRVTLTGLASNDCIAAESTVEVTLAGARFPITIDAPLDLLPAQRCTLTLTVRHSGGTTGRVSSQPAALDCTTAQGSCTYTFTPSTTETLDLAAETDIHSYFTWIGSCQGNGPCKISLDRRRDEVIAFDPRACLLPDLCFHSPTPRDATFTAIASVGSHHAWAVGYGLGGMAAHYVEGRWLLVPTGVNSPLRSVWTEASGTALAAGDHGTVVRFADTGYTVIPTADTSKLNGVWGTDSSNAWAVGDSGTVIRIVGSTGHRIPTPVDNGPSLNAVWGSGSNDVWAVGNGGTAVRWDGTKWNVFAAPDSAANYVSVFGSGPNDVWLLGDKRVFRWDGTNWRLMRQEQEQVLRGFARSPTDVWVLRENQRVSTFNGVLWHRDIIPVYSVANITALSPAGDSGVWAAGSHGLISRGQDGIWTDTSGQTPTQNRYRLQAVWGAAPDEVWACGSSVLLKWNGHQWESVSLAENVDCGTLFGSARDDIWMLGVSGGIWHFDGWQWNKLQMLSGLSFQGGVALSKTEAYGVGLTGTVLKWDGSSWSLGPKLVATPLRAAWAASPTDIWIVGDAGVILRRQDVSWSVIPKPTSASFLSVRGVSSNDVHLVGAELWHWNGSIFSQFPRATATPSIPSYVNLHDVIAWPDGSALAVGDFGTVLRYAQGVWTVSSYGDARTLYGLAPSGATGAWVVGENQTILRYSP